MLQLRYPTSVRDWIPSVHLIKNIVLFASADELFIHRDTTYGKLKKATDKVIEEGEFVSMMLSVAKYPFSTCLTIFARRNGLNCLAIADDLRQQTIGTSLLGLAVILPTPDSFGRIFKCHLVVLDTMVHKSE